MHSSAKDHHFLPFNPSTNRVYIYARTDGNRRRPATVVVPQGSWEIISTDLIGPLPESQGYDAIAVFVDRKTKQCHIAPTTTTVTSEGYAKLLRDNVFRLHGIPIRIISDRGPQFVSKFMKDFYGLIGIEPLLSTAYHPQTNGQTEQVNQEIEVFL